MAFARKTGTNYVFTKTANSVISGGGGGGSGGGGGGGGGSGSSSSSGGGGGGSDCDEIRMFINSTLLKNINTINDNYASGRFDSIKTQLTQTAYNTLSLQLFKAKRPMNPDYEKLRKVINLNLEGLLQSINLYNTNVDMTGERNYYKIKADKFNDVNALIEQLNMLRRAVSLFPDQTITVIPVEIKPEYLAYIKTYGYPENGIWDPDLLGAILSSIRPATI
jgi:hypothetical protein